jgi:hypothetical protein
VDIIGTQECPFRQVQKEKKLTDGYRFKNEENISIVALMRGGEPMALAMFVHDHRTSVLTEKHLEGRHAAVLVVGHNNGNAVVDFVKKVRALKPDISIVVIAGVVQAKSISFLELGMGSGNQLTVVPLRISDNKFEGKGLPILEIGR